MARRPARQKRLHLSQHPWRDAGVALLLLLVLVAGGLKARDAGSTAELAAEHEAALGTMEAHFAVSHTWLEEYVAGDPSVDLAEDVYGNQAEAARLCAALRDGGAAAGSEHIAALGDREAKGLTTEACRGMRTFRLLTDKRVSEKRTERVGTAAEERYDRVFLSVLEDADALRGRLQDITAEQHDQARTTEILVVVGLVGLLIAAAFVVRRRERELAALAAEREVVLESAAEGILAVDRNGIVQYANGAATTMLGWPTGELPGQPFHALLPADQRPTGVRPLPEWVEVEEAARGDDRELCGYDGRTLPIAYSVAPPPRRATAGTFVITFQDASRRRRREAQREAELDELRTIKQALVPPEVGEHEGVRIATCHVAAEDGVAGDFHLVADGPRGSTVVVVGDVAGKGMAAARRAVYLRAALATFALYEDDPCRLLELGNRSLLDAAGVSHMFVTAVCVVLAPDGRVTWASAGHPAPVHVPSGKPLEGRPCLPLGLTPDLDCPCHESALDSGAGLILFTDGLTEARSDDLMELSLLGGEQIGQMVRELGDVGPQALTDALRALAERHSGGRLADDLCMVALRFSPAAATSSSGSPSHREGDAG